MGAWRWSPSFLTLLSFLGWVAAGAIGVALPWALFRQLHFQVSIVYCQHAFELWNDPHPELTVLVISLGEGAVIGGLVCLSIGLLHRGALGTYGHAVVLLRAIVARLVLTSLLVGIGLTLAAVLTPTLYERLTTLPVGMGLWDDASWAFNAGTTWGWLVGAGSCIISAWRNPAWRLRRQATT
jgi:hypothetical protein